MGLIGAFQTVKPEPIKEEITTSGTWTVPEGVTEIEVRLFGGGGGGATSGGGGGYMAYAKMTVTPGTQYAITIGAGGAADTAGGATSFGTSLTAQGGQPGSSTGGGDGGTGGGGAVESDKASYGGNGQYGGGGGGYSHYKISSSIPTTSCTGYGLGGVYGGNGAVGGARYIAAQPGIDSNGGKNYCSYDGTNNGTSTNGYYGAGGGGGYKANGGDAYAMGSDTNVSSYGGGGGGGWEGGDGGSGGYASNGGDVMGGGGGGYGPLKLAEDGKYKNYPSDAAYKIGGRGGLGYGAGGGGGSGVEEGLPGAGAPGICVIKYKKGW